MIKDEKIINDAELDMVVGGGVDRMLLIKRDNGTIDAIPFLGSTKNSEDEQKGLATLGKYLRSNDAYMIRATRGRVGLTKKEANAFLKQWKEAHPNIKAEWL